MDFKVYQVTYDGDLTRKGTNFYTRLKSLDRQQGDHGLVYCITRDVEIFNNIITGSLTQEYIPSDVNVDEQRNVRPLADVEPYIRTLFALDLVTQCLLVQQRNYSPRNLNPQRTLSRIAELISNAFTQTYNVEFNYVPSVLPIENDYFLRIIRTSKVRRIKISSIDLTHQVPKVDLIDNVRANEGWVEVWNSDTSGLRSVTIEATPDGDLYSSPLLQTLLSVPGVVIDELKYVDDELGRLVTKKRRTLDRLTIRNIDLATENVTAFQEIQRTVIENKQLLRNMRRVIFD